MADKKNNPVDIIEQPQTVDRVTGFWEKNSKIILIALVAFVVGAGGYTAYKYLISEPNRIKSNEAIFRAEAYFRLDSLQLALNGDATNPGFIKIMDKYSGTPAASLSEFYAGACYLRLGDYTKAEKYLKSFSTDAIQVKARAKCLLGDVYAEQGKKEEAAKMYMEAGKTFEKDEQNSADYLSRAGAMYEIAGKKSEAIEAYKLIKQKYPRSEKGFDVDKYLARLGVTE